jgi:acyl dehydratase
MTEKLTLKKIKKYRGREVCLSDWFEITQDRISDFAECTEDRQWIHVDIKKAKKSPLGGTVAHGFLVLSLIPYLSRKSEIFSYDCKMMVNYGVNKVRFIHPVRPGSRIRNRAVLEKVEKRGFRRILAHVQNTLEIEGEDKPALVAEVLVLFYV